MGLFAVGVPQPSPATEGQITQAEHTLGFALPSAYKELLRRHNGGQLDRTCFRTTARNSWASDHIAVQELFGVGTATGLDGELGSRYLILEWDYPDVGLVLFATPSAGHDTVMLDYRCCGAEGEPSVVYVDEVRNAVPMAATFASFVAALEPEANFSVG